MLIKLFLLFLLTLTFPVNALQNPNNFGPVEKRVQETNFLQIEISQYQFSHPKSQVIIAAEESSDRFYAADRALNKIEKLLFLDNKSIEKISSQSVPEIKGLRPFILDLHFSKDNNVLYVSLFYWSKNKKDCSKVIVYEVTTNLQNFKPIFESSPCISIQSGFHEISGRLASNENSVFIASGNILMDIYNNSYPRNDLCCFNKNESYEDLLKKTNLFGSVVKISKDNFSSTKISQGHRVPEGLFFDKSSNILWESEHGPRGGDELNIIENNNNYGWPYETLGNNYDKKIGTFLTKFNSDKSYTPPIYAWIPSIGASQILVISKNNKYFKDWSDSLIVSSLKDKSIHILKTRGKNITADERVFIGQRLRDLEVSKAGILASTDNGRIIRISKSKENPTGAYPIIDYDWSICAIERDSPDCKLSPNKPKNAISRIIHNVINLKLR